MGSAGNDAEWVRGERGRQCRPSSYHKRVKREEAKEREKLMKRVSEWVSEWVRKREIWRERERERERERWREREMKRERKWRERENEERERDLRSRPIDPSILIHPNLRRRAGEPLGPEKAKQVIDEALEELRGEFDLIDKRTQVW